MNDNTGKKFSIPPLPKAQAAALHKRIKPVVDFGKQGKRFIKPVDVENTAYTWDPKPTTKAEGLRVLGDVRTLHRYGYYGMFKPSIAEVLAQIPKEWINEAVAFEIIESPQTADDLNKEPEALNAGFHVAKTRIYGVEK